MRNIMNKIFNKRFAKPLVLVVCAAVLVASSVGITVCAVKSGNDGEENVSDKAVSLTAAKDKSKLEKDETVYVLAGADGSVKKIIVSDWIKNSLSNKSISDKSELKDVQNVKGDETYTMNGDNMRVWDAEGNDIYYQGNISKELPVNLSVSYKLDGKEIAADKLAGKSGKLTVRYEYKNNQYETVTIDGKQEKIYVPFAMLTGMMLDNDVFRNVEVTNGKIINDGNRTVVMGIAFPGMQSNLNISKDKFDVPDYVEITADVKKFEMTNTVTVATNEIFNKLNTDSIDSLADLKKSVKEITSAMDQLIDGSSKLYTGLDTLLNKSGELVDGINKLADGAAKLKSGTGTLDSGTAELLKGLTTLTENNDALNNGATDVYESLLSTVESQFKASGLTVDKLTIDNYKTVLGKLLSAPNADQTKAMVAMANSTLEEKLAKSGVPEAQYQPVKYMLYERLSAGKTTDDAMQEIGAVLYGAQAGDLSSQQALYKATVTAASEEGKKAISGLCLSMAKESLKPKIDEAVKSLDSYGEFYTGLKSYTAGVSSACDGAGKLKAGTAELREGSAELYDGVLQLKNGAPALTDGVKQLRDGAMQLSDGLKEFNKKGIQRLIDAVDGDVGGLVTRIKATADVSKDYKSFTGISDDMSGQVKFIYRTDAIKK